MPPVSKSQAHLMGMACAGLVKPPGGMTRAQCCEYVRGASTKGLPEHVKKGGK